MDAVEMIYLLAASLWIVAVLGALCIGVRVAMKVRAKRRRMNLLVDTVLVSIGLGARGRRPGTTTQLASLLPEFARSKPPRRGVRR